MSAALIQGFERRVVVVTNQKGGVGKTTLTRELGLAFAHLGLRVLLADADAQGNLTRSLIDDSRYPMPEAGLADALDFATGAASDDAGNGDELMGRHAAPMSLRPGLDLLAGGRGLALFERRVIAELDCYTRMKTLLGRERYDEYDLVLIDTPPSLGLLTVNALAAADSLVIPMNPAQYTMQGTNDLLGTVAKAQATLNPGLEFSGVVLNAVDPVPAIVKEIVSEIRKNFEEKCFENFITKSVRIEEAIAEKKGLIELPGSLWKKSRLEVEKVTVELAKRLWPSGFELLNGSGSGFLDLAVETEGRGP